MNLLLAIILVGISRVALLAHLNSMVIECWHMANLSLVLCFFNLLPIPPLDGSALIERVLPGAWLPHWYRFRPYGILVLFILVFSTGIISEFLRPFEQRLINFVFF